MFDTLLHFLTFTAWIGLACVVCLTIYYGIVFLKELQKAMAHFKRVEPKIQAITANIESMQQKIAEIENTPLISFNTNQSASVKRYAKMANQVLKARNKRKTKVRQKQEKQLKKRMNQVKKQEKTNKKALRVQRKVSKKYGK